MDADRQVRELLARQLDWGEAHVGFDRALAGFADHLQGVVPVGSAHSGWQLLEHMRRAQADILDFCVNPDYVSPASLDEYWPAVAPSADESWDAAAAAFEDDLTALKRLALDESLDLFARVPTATSETQTLARALILVTDHNAYHLGQLVSVRRALGEWREGPSELFYHGTRVDLKPGDLIEPGFRSNYGTRKQASHVYLTATLDAATWGAELAVGDGPGRIYTVEPTGPIEDDPNLTDKKFPGNPTRSYRTREALRVTGEVTGWRGHSPEELKAMKDNLERLKKLGVEAIED